MAAKATCQTKRRPKYAIGDWYMAIVHPLRHRRSKTRTQTILVLIWLVSVFLAMPCILYSELKTKRYTNGELRRACYMLWPDGRYPHSKTEYIYNILFLCVTYIIPLAVMAVCYTIMGRELWGSKTIGQMTQRHVESIKSKRKVVRMFAVVVTIFLICWFPYHSYFVYAYHNKGVVVKPYVQDLFLSFYWLAMSNSMVNPIIYYWMNPRFRAYFKLIICYCGGLRKSDKAPIDLNMIRVNGESHYYLSRSKSVERLTRSSIVGSPTFAAPTRNPSVVSAQRLQRNSAVPGKTAAAADQSNGNENNQTVKVKAPGTTEGW